ncbi:hypothetical protein O7608_16825 [Solwaraspora sp. WMMA2056]|nr:hypothetical protein [Solwaraspora sp. WMMA2056]WJK38181.1 hypothetical protein O7608_16825 [Solwaraspora sp. WMMA2056]
MVSKRAGVLVAATLLALAPAVPAVAAVPEATVHAVGGPTAVANSYIVVLADTAAATSTVDRTARAVADRHGGTVARNLAPRPARLRSAPDAAPGPPARRRSPCRLGHPEPHRDRRRRADARTLLGAGPHRPTQPATRR